MMFILLPLLILFVGLAAGSAWVYFKEEQPKQKNSG